MESMERRQSRIDAFYHAKGPCCAGCDWWRWHSALLGECTRSAPVSADETIGMLGIKGFSGPLEAGHVLTPREHFCGEFRDTYLWTDEEIGKLRNMFPEMFRKESS